MQAKQPIMSLGVAEIVYTYRILRLVVGSGFRNTYPAGPSQLFLPILRSPMSFRDEGSLYFDATIAGGFQVPSPGGKIEGGVSFGQYRRITR